MTVPDDATASSYYAHFGIDPDTIDRNATYSPRGFGPVVPARSRPIDRHDDPGFRPAELGDVLEQLTTY